LHVYKFGESNTLAKELYEKTKPGLSYYVNQDEDLAADSIATLLDKAKNIVPQHLWSTTPLSLKATGGVRALNEEVQDRIMNAVRVKMATYPFEMTADSVSVISGEDEGFYMWLAVNTLLDNISPNKISNSTVGTIELGGQSQQVSFLSSDSVGLNEILDFNSSSNEFFSKSYFALGINSARATVFDSMMTPESNETKSRCFPPGFEKDWTESGKRYLIKSANKESKTNWYRACKKQVKKAFKNSLKDLSSNIADSRKFYVLSVYYYKALELGLIGSDGGVFRPVDFDREGRKLVCTNSEERKQKIKDSGHPSFPFLCMDINLASFFLKKVFGFSKKTQLYTLKSIKGFRITWALGLALKSRF